MKEHKSPCTITFSSHYIGNSHQPETDIHYEVNGDADLQEMCSAFENFLLACGFRLNNNQTIGVIENEYL